MPQLDLATLNGSELRRLLDASRQRGQAAQSYQILEEMARRREAEAARPKRGRRRQADEARIISIDLGDPLDRPDPADEPTAAATPAPEALTLEPRQSARETPHRRWGAPLATFVIGAALGGGLGVWAADEMRDPAPSSPELAVLQAELAPPPVPAPQPEAPPAAAPEPAASAEPAPVEAVEAPAEPAAPPAEVAEAAPLSEPDAACASAPSPADRVICGDPHLQRLQQDLRRAYAEALDAHEERDVLRERQLAWRDARNTVTDPDRLAALYEQRIRKLEAATADARRQR